MSALLRFRHVVVPDWPPPFRYALPLQHEFARSVVEALSLGLGDADAWHFALGDEARLHTHRAVYGNRKGGRRRQLRRAA